MTNTPSGGGGRGRGRKLEGGGEGEEGVMWGRNRDGGVKWAAL